VGQQLSVGERLGDLAAHAEPVPTLRACGLEALEDAVLASAGMSRAKIRTLRAIALACSNGLELAALEAQSDAEIASALDGHQWHRSLDGRYLHYVLSRRGDGFAAGDLALQIGAQQALGLKARPSAG
jgi:DNA-3-methyladenine glycosylase II